MELCLSLGDLQTPEPSGSNGFSSSSEKLRDDQVIMTTTNATGFCMSLSIGGPSWGTPSPREADQKRDHRVVDLHQSCGSSKVHVPVQLDLLPHTPVVPRTSSHGFPWSTPDQNGAGRVGGSSDAGGSEVKRVEEVAAAVSSSPTNSGASSFQMDINLYRNHRGGGDQNNKSRGNSLEGDEGEMASKSRASDEDDIINGSTRKKLRLCKEQSAFLEESFKEHHTLNPKQKLALAKQLDLRPRQVEVWFQNRRARTKLKQTEVDSEFLKRCCETLTEENRRLHKEVQELRALKTHNSNPFNMQSPATTLTMCPSCERTATNTNTDNINATTTSSNNNDNIDSISTTRVQAAGFRLSRPRFYPFSQHQSHRSSAAS